MIQGPWCVAGCPDPRMRMARVGLSLLALVLAAITGFVLWHSVQVSSVLSVQARLESWQPLLTAARIGALALVAVGGFLFLHLRHRAGRISVHVLKHRLARHWRLVAWLVVIEALLGQQLLRYFIAAGVGT